MMDSITVWTIVGIVLILSARSLYLTFTGKNKGCCCGENACSGSCCSSFDSSSKNGTCDRAIEDVQP